MLNNANNNGNSSKPDVNTGMDLLVEVEGVETVLLVIVGGIVVETVLVVVGGIVVGSFLIIVSSFFLKPI